MFDQSKTFTVPIMSGGIKKCVVNFPTDQQWCARAHAQKVIRRPVGGGKWTFEPSDLARIDSVLFRDIRVEEEGSVAFDDSEAAAVIERLERCQVQGIQREGETLAVTLKVAGAVVVVHLAIPYQRDVMAYGRESMPPPVHSARATELRINLEPAGRLFDKILRSQEGYAGAVPIIHKDVALQAVLAEIQAMEEEVDPEN
jgi:hypothetical protein